MEFNLENLIRAHLRNALVYENNRPLENSSGAMYLDANESPFGSYNRYPDGQQRVLKARLSVLNGVSDDRIFMGNGSDELIDLLMRIFCEPEKDSIMCLDPSFSMYEIYANFNHLKIEKLTLNSDFQLDLNEFTTKIVKTEAKILFVCSPNNPTGNSIENLEFLIQSFPGLVVVDEAYIEFSPNESATKYLEQYPNLIVLKTLSKAYGMAGLRLGIGFASTEIATLISRLKPPFNTSSVSQQIAEERLVNVEALKKNIEVILQEKEILASRLESLDIVQKVFPSDANFLLVRFKNASDIYRTLLDNAIYTSLRHPGIENCIRITVGSKTENLKLITILNQIQR